MLNLQQVIIVNYNIENRIQIRSVVFEINMFKWADALENSLCFCIYIHKYLFKLNMLNINNTNLIFIMMSCYQTFLSKLCTLQLDEKFLKQFFFFFVLHIVR